MKKLFKFLLALIVFVVTIAFQSLFIWWIWNYCLILAVHVEPISFLFAIPLSIAIRYLVGDMKISEIQMNEKVEFKRFVKLSLGNILVTAIYWLVLYVLMLFV